MRCENDKPHPGRSINSGAVMLEPDAGMLRLNLYMPESSHLDKWEARADRVRSSMRKGVELDPWPSMGAPNSVIHSRRTYNGYSVENVFFEAFPGFYVTGNLYRPYERPGPFPGILINMGHFPLSRHEADHQLLAATLARMGSVVFIYDMMGYGESHQPRKMEPSHDHNFVKATKLELFDALRSLDFLTSLTDVDPKRMGVTGASGGGSRTMFLTALDQRVKACAPVAMVSDYYYGGCVCESGMPICYCGEVDTVLADIAAIAAPRPMLIVSDGQDWTKTVPQSEYPYIKRIYGLYEAQEIVSNVHLATEGHDFGFNKRKSVYEFFAREFKLTSFIDELDCVHEPWSYQMSFTDTHPIPRDALIGDEAILKGLNRIASVKH